MEADTKFFKSGQPVVRNRASIVHSALAVTFLSKEQCDGFVTALLAQEEYPNLSIETNVGDSITHTQYIVTLQDICWANNLRRIAELLERYDYNDSVANGE